VTRRLEGKVAVVTGGGRGIGRAVAVALAAHGAKVVVNDYGVSVEGINPSTGPVNETVAIIRQAGGQAVASFGDVCSYQYGQELVQTAIDTYGKLDILINLAGTMRGWTIFNTNEEEWDTVVAVHLKGTFNTTRFAAEHWRDRFLQRGERGGRLINCGSDAGLVGSAARPNYSAAKEGIVGFTRSCARMLGQYGVTCNTIAPGATTRFTDWFLKAKGQIREGDPLPSQSAQGSNRDPMTIAPLVIYLASDEADYVSGRVFYVHDGTISLVSEPVPERTLYSPNPMWDVDELFKAFKSTLGAGLSIPPYRD